MMIGSNKIKFNCSVILLLFMISTGTAYAQLKSKIEHYSTEDGLSHDGVMSMTRDHEGFMWFATWDGINRFDGHNFITYKTRPGDSSDLRNNRIQYLKEDRMGYLWMKAYNKQIYRFDKRKEKFASLEDLTKTPIKGISFDRIIPFEKAGIWFTTKEQGLFCAQNLQSAHPRLTRYDSNAAAGFRLPSGTIIFFYEDQQHHFWIGTGKGLACLEKDKSGVYRTIRLNPDFAGRLIFTDIAEDKGKLWFSTTAGELVYYEKSSGKFFSKKVSSNSLNSVYFSKKRDAVYLSTSKSELITLTIPGLQASSAVMPGAGKFLSVYEDKSGLLWIEPEKYGVIKYDPDKRSFRYYTQKSDATFDMPAKTYNITQDNRGVLWVCMKGGGFGYYNATNDSVEYFYDKPGSETRQFSNLVTCKYFDPAGVLWLSTNDRGLNKIIFQRDDFNQKLVVEKTINKSDNDIRSIFNDHKNRLWLGTKSGKLYVYDNKGKRVDNLFTNEPEGGLGFVYTIIQDKNKAIWLGTKGNGLFKAEPTDQEGGKYKLSHYLADEQDVNSLSSNLIYSLLEDKKGRIWVGTYGQGLNLVVVKNNTTTFLNAKNTFFKRQNSAFDKIRHLQEDARGKIWIATTDGLLVLDPDVAGINNARFKIFRKIPGDKNSLGNNSVQFIFRDSKDRMWISTSGGGLNMAVGTDPFASLKFEVFTMEDGLPNDYILNSVEDNQGNLWLATENGLSKFNPEKRQFRNYDSYDGVPKTGFSEASSLKLPDGNLIFGGTNGYITFNPRVITDHKVDEPMALTNLQVNNQDVAPGEKNSPLEFSINNTQSITLKYNQNIISIDYAVLDFRAVNKQVYAYRLTGFDTIWHSSKNQHRATYTNLPPGNYVFEVKSLSNDLYSNKPAKTVAITILPPPWRTWWAYLLYIIIATVLIETIRRTAFTMVRLRNRISVERRLADLKLSFFTNISHELRTPLTLILNPIEEIFQKEKLSDQGHRYIDVVRKNANRMVRFINQLLDLRKVESGKASLQVTRIELLSFVKDIGNYFTEIASEKQIELLITSDLNELYVWADAEKIDIVIYNLLANAFKFTPERKEIKVEIAQDPANDTFSISVIDQGAGVLNEQLTDIFELYYEGDKRGNYLKGTGIGLALSKELVELHSGKIAAKNNADGGLTVTVELRPGNAHFKSEDIIDQEDLKRSGQEGFELTGNENLQLTDQQHPGLPEQKNKGISDQQHQLIADDIVPLADPVACTDNDNAPLVLLVEDNYDLRKFLLIQLQANYRIAEAENGKEGLEKAMELLPDLILSDVMMPEMDGIEMLDKLKNNLSTSHIPVVLLTAKFAVESQIEGLKYGADYYITKPFHNDFLLASIENLLKQRKKILESFLTDKKTIVLSPGEITITSKDEVFLKEIIRIVENGMADPAFNIDSVAESIGMGRTTFYKKFKSLTNLAPVEFVREMRLKRGMQLLDAGENNVSEIAYAVGFSSAGYFSTCFKEKFHVSPSEYYKTKIPV